MNAAETIQAAIDKLEAQRKAASILVMFLPLENDKPEYDLGTTLYRTIVPQLGMLSAILKVHTDLVPLPFDDFDAWPIPAYALELAKAILRT